MNLIKIQESHRSLNGCQATDLSTLLTLLGVVKPVYYESRQAYDLIKISHVNASKMFREFKERDATTTMVETLDRFLHTLLKKSQIISWAG